MLFFKLIYFQDNFPRSYDLPKLHAFYLTVSTPYVSCPKCFNDALYSLLYCANSGNRDRHVVARERMA